MFYEYFSNRNTIVSQLKCLNQGFVSVNKDSKQRRIIPKNDTRVFILHFANGDDARIIYINIMQARFFQHFIFIRRPFQQKKKPKPCAQQQAKAKRQTKPKIMCSFA